MHCICLGSCGLILRIPFNIGSDCKMAPSIKGAASSCMPLLLLINFGICLVTVQAGLETEMCIFFGSFVRLYNFVSRSETEGTPDVCPCMIAQAERWDAERWDKLRTYHLLEPKFPSKEKTLSYEVRGQGFSWSLQDVPCTRAYYKLHGALTCLFVVLTGSSQGIMRGLKKSSTPATIELD
jgi:hypothetical protein